MAKTDWQIGDTVQPEDMNQLGQEINELRTELDNIEIPPASTEKAGIVQLSNAVNSLSESLAATPKAVKTAYDRAEQAFQLGNERKEEVVDALIAVGVSASTSESWDSLISKIASVIRATGNADRSEVLSGRTFSNASANGLTGTMPNRGAVAATLTNQGQQYTVPQGYHNGQGKVTANIANLNAGNVRSGATVGGVAGTFSSFTNGAAANQILTGRSAAVNGNVVNGTMPNLGGNQPAQAVRARNNTILGLRPQQAGYYPAGTGNWLEWDEPNWKPENIVEGVSMFGKVGTLEHIEFTAGDNFTIIEFPDESVNTQYNSREDWGRYAGFPQVTFKFGGTVRLRYAARWSSSGSRGYIRWYNATKGIPYSERTITSTNTVSFTEDISVDIGDVVLLQAKWPGVKSGRFYVGLDQRITTAKNPLF